MKYFFCVIICLITIVTHGQNLSLDETVVYINKIFLSSKSDKYKYDLILSSDGKVTINEYDGYDNKYYEYKVDINDLGNTYISKDIESCSGSVQKNLDYKHIQIWCKNKSDYIFNNKYKEKYTCNLVLYLDISEYDYQRCLNALKYLIAEGKKTFAPSRNQVNDPFAPKAKIQGTMQQTETPKQSVSKKNIVNTMPSQSCDVKVNNRSDGVVIRYLNPELVGKGNNCELGLSVQTNGGDYFLTTTVRYLEDSQKMIGRLKVQLTNSQSLDLKLYRSELASMKNEQVSLGIYYLTSTDVQKLTNSNIKTIVFQEANNKYQVVSLSQNLDVIKRHLKCLKEI